MASRTDLVLPAILGVMAGGRSQSVSAFIAWQGLDRRASTPLGRAAATLSLAGETVADKTPLVPPRTRVGSLFGRMVFGAMGGVAAARHRRGSVLPSVLVAGAAAAAATFGLNRARTWLGEHTPLPDFAWAIAEDAGVAALGVAAARRL